MGVIIQLAASPASVALAVATTVERSPPTGWTLVSPQGKDVLMEKSAERRGVPGQPASIDEHATVESARRTLEAALRALRELQAQQHQTERLVRQALDALRQLPQAETAPTVHESPFLSVAEVAEVLGVSRHQAWRMVRDGTVPSCKLGRRVVVARATLGDWGEALGGPGLGGPKRQG
jgi:excisionase family DNA binding protein